MSSEYLVGVDPGLVTGLALVQRDGDLAVRLISVEIPPEEIALSLRRWFHSLRDEKITVVVEAFIITGRTGKLSQQPFSLENIGIVKQCMRDAEMDMNTQLVMHKPGVKDIVDNDKLRRVELWHRGGAGHANDALRHVAIRLINVGWRDPRLLKESDPESKPRRAMP